MTKKKKIGKLNSAMITMLMTTTMTTIKKMLIVTMQMKDEAYAIDVRRKNEIAKTELYSTTTPSRHE